MDWLNPITTVLFSSIRGITEMGLSALRCILIIWVIHFHLEKMETISGIFHWIEKTNETFSPPVNVTTIYDHQFIHMLLVPCKFVAVPKSQCPCSDTDDTGCNISECSPTLDFDALCEADAVLPDGNSTFEIGNCPGGYDVFKCSPGK